MGEKVSSIYVELGADASGLQRGFNQAQEATQKLRASIAETAKSTVGLNGRIGDFGNMLKGATPENLRFARSFEQIQKDFEEGKITIGDAKRAIGDLSSEMGIGGQKTETFGDKLKGLGSGFMSVMGFAAKAGAAVAGFGIAFTKIMEFGKSGAQIELTEMRFGRLAEKIGTTADALRDDLKGATGGLMSDMEMLASATDFMSLGLVKTHDEAVRLTKVAGQLGMNMNQLVLTLTNQTTMRFDALGVAVDGFDEKVEALKATGMSASDAFNEAFLQQAEEQIETVGSVAGTAAGQFMKMEASLKNVGDTVKTALLPGLVSAAGALDNLVNMAGNINGVYDEHFENLKKTTKSYAEYIEGVKGSLAVNNRFYMDMGQGVKVYERVGDSMIEVVHDFDIMSEAQYRANKRFGDNTAAAMAYQASLYGLEESTEGVTEATETMLPWQLRINEAQQEAAATARLAAVDGYNLKAAQDEYTASLEASNDAIVPYVATLEDMANAMASIRDNANDATDKTNNLAEALKNASRQEMVDIQLEFIKGLNLSSTEYEKFTREILIDSGRATEATYAQADAIETWVSQMVEAGIIGEEELGKVFSIVKTEGADAKITYDELTQALINAGITTQEEVDKMNGIDLGEAIGETGSLAGNLTTIFGLPDSKNFKFHVDITSSGNAGLITGGGHVAGSGAGVFADVIEHAGGGSYMIPPGYHENWPVGPGHVASSGETVSITPAGGKDNSNDKLEALLLDQPRMIALAIRDVLLKSEAVA